MGAGVPWPGLVTIFFVLLLLPNVVSLENQRRLTGSGTHTNIVLQQHL